MIFHSVIIGAGAAGLFCAIESAKQGHKTLIIDHSKKIGEKIRISGGGRCNFTNLHTTPENFISENKHFCVSALKRFTQYDFIKLVEKHKIAYHEKTLGQLFCDGQSQQIIDMLLQECKSNQVTIKSEVEISNVTKQEQQFQITTNIGIINCNALVIATGGLSIPKIGASNFGYLIAEQFGLKIIPPQAALVPFLIKNPKMNALAGIAIKDAIVSCNNKSFREGILFTHKGLSGPAILQISSYWNYNDVITINLLPNINVLQILKDKRQSHPKQQLHNILAQLLPKKLANFIAEDINQQLSDLSNKRLEKIADKINKWEIIPDDTEGYRTAEVTRGGVDTNEISSKTFEAKKVKGLYFIGEILDVTGHLGGFNFQWAWSSGHAAGSNLN